MMNKWCRAEVRLRTSEPGSKKKMKYEHNNKEAKYD